MHAEHIKKQKFSGSFFPWKKKIKKTQHCSSGSLPSASILSKIKVIEKRQNKDHASEARMFLR